MTTYTMTPEEAEFAERTKNDLTTRVNLPDTVEWESERSYKPSPGLPMFWAVNGTRRSPSGKETVRFCVSCEHTGAATHKPGTEQRDNIFVWAGKPTIRVTAL